MITIHFTLIVQQVISHYDKTETGVKIAFWTKINFFISANLFISYSRAVLASFDGQLLKHTHTHTHTHERGRTRTRKRETERERETSLEINV